LASGGSPVVAALNPNRLRDRFDYRGGKTRLDNPVASGQTSELPILLVVVLLPPDLTPSDGRDGCTLHFSVKIGNLAVIPFSLDARRSIFYSAQIDIFDHVSLSAANCRLLI
jgi:hypothetical protein